MITYSHASFVHFVLVLQCVLYDSIVARLTSDIELAFDGNLTGDAVFGDLTSAYATAWRR